MLILDSSILNNCYSTITYLDCTSLASCELKLETPKPITLTDLIVFDKDKPHTQDKYSYHEKHLIWDFTPNEQKLIVQFTTVISNHSFLVFLDHDCYLFWLHTAPSLLKTKKKTTADRFYKLGFNPKSIKGSTRCLQLHQFLAHYFSDPNNLHL